MHFRGKLFSYFLFFFALSHFSFLLCLMTLVIFSSDHTYAWAAASLQLLLIFSKRFLQHGHGQAACQEIAKHTPSLTLCCTIHSSIIVKILLFTQKLLFKDLWNTPGHIFAKV